MKKWIAALAALLLLCCPRAALAVPTGESTVPGSQGIEVSGSRQDSKNYYEITLGVTGMDTVSLPENITLSGKSSAAADQGLRVVIIPVTAGEEPEAWAWLTRAAASLGQEPVAYYLAFYRDSSPAQPQGSVTITLTARTDYQNNRLYYMDGAARSKSVPRTNGRGNFHFTMERTGYYIQVKGSDQPTIIIDPQNPPPNPGTGTPAGQIPLALLAGMVLLAPLAALPRGKKTP